MARGIKIASGVLMAALVLCLGIAILGYSAWKDPRRAAEHILSYRLSRPVTIDAARFDVGHWSTIAMDGVHIRNAPWGTKPDFIRIGHLEAQLQLASLFSGAPLMRATRIDDALIFLERNSAGEGNWSFGGGHRPHGSHAEEVEAGRGGLPTMLALALHNFEIRMKTSSGNELSIMLANFELAAASEDAPVSLKVDGAYNGTPAKLDVETQSFQVLHDGKQPFHADIKGEAETAFIRLKADMMDPLNFEDVDSHLAVEVKQIGRAAALFGGAFDGDIPLEFNCRLTRRGDDWGFDDLIGHSRATEFSKSSIALREGARRKPDILKIDLAFQTFDLTPIMATKTAQDRSGPEWRLEPLDRDVGALIEADLKARRVLTDRGDFDEVSLHASRSENGIAIKNLRTLAFGGELEGNLRATSAGKATQVKASASIRDGNLERLWAAAGVGKDVLRGPFTLGLDLAADGSTEAQLKTSLKGAVVFAMKGGAASKKAIELASLDLRGLFRHSETATNMKCLLAVVKVKDGIGRLAPFRLATDDGTILGDGTIDLARNYVDLALQAESDTVKPGALDKPISISGALESPKIRPLLLSKEHLERERSSPPPEELPSTLKNLVVATDCGED